MREVPQRGGLAAISEAAWPLGQTLDRVIILDTAKLCTSGDGLIPELKSPLAQPGSTALEVQDYLLREYPDIWSGRKSPEELPIFCGFDIEAFFRLLITDIALTFAPWKLPPNFTRRIQRVDAWEVSQLQNTDPAVLPQLAGVLRLPEPDKFKLHTSPVDELVLLATLVARYGLGTEPAPLGD